MELVVLFSTLLFLVIVGCAFIVGHVLSTMARKEEFFMTHMKEVEEAHVAQVNSLLMKTGVPISYYAPAVTPAPQPDDGLHRYVDPTTGFVMVESGMFEE